MLNPKALEAFRMIVVTGSTTAAAESMRISQPAVSRLLKSLEETLGYALFARIRGRLSPTPEGMALFEEVERYFSGLEGLERVALQISGNRGRSYRVATMPAIGLHFFPKAVCRLGLPGDLPALSLVVMRSQTVAAMTLSRQCDLGVLSGAVDESGMQVVGQHAMECLCILPPGHPLAARGIVAWSDFADFPMVSLNSTTITGLRIATALKAARVRPTITVETHQSTAVSTAVLSGAGIGVVDASNAQAHAERGGVVRPLSMPVFFDFKVVKPIGLARTAIQPRLLDAVAAEMESVAHWVAALRAQGLRAAGRQAAERLEPA